VLLQPFRLVCRVVRQLNGLASVPASAIRWCALAAATGSAVARPRGGDRLSHRIEAQAARIHALLAEKDDLTLAEIRARLADTNGYHV